MSVDSFIQKRRKNLEANINETLNLLKEYEDKRRLSDDPKEKMKCDSQIIDQRQLLDGYKVELKRLEAANIEMPTDPQLSTPIKISLGKLPSTNHELFGRDNELKMLDAAWANPQTNLITLVAWGGVGKTALVNTWLSSMRQDNFRGAERVFGWSFYSQGAAEGKQVSADVFIASALKWFGDPKPDEGSPWEKGERLAELIKKQKTLFILDGLEPLQNPPGEGEGRIKDPALQSLLREMANHNPGLCVISTRLKVDDIKDFMGNSVQNIPLEHLSLDAGKDLLEHLGVKGTSDELKQASREFGCHALALTLLGKYLAVVYSGDVRKRNEIARLTDEEEQGGHAKRVMESYEEWFKGKPELDILRIMGLFDRPADGGAIEALRAKPPISGLTSDLQQLSDTKWRFTLNRLRKAGLLANEYSEPDKLDCHPLIREYFGENLKENNPEGWKEAHSRLYEYYKDQAKEYPDTIQEMMPLYAAVAHGCQAGRYHVAFEDVYRQRIQRRNQYFDVKKLGAFGADLAALAGFFDSLWDKPVAGLTESNNSLVLGNTGTFLHTLGRLAEAAQPLKASMEAYNIQEDWINAAQATNNLSELSLTIGNLAQSLEYAEQSIDLADCSGDAFQRISTRTTLANALHQAGRLSEAEAAFKEAEEMLKEWPPEVLFLYSLSGFRYCELLLSQGKYRDVQSRAQQMIEWEEGRLLDIALDHLSLGKAYLTQARQEGTDDFTQSSDHLNQAVDGLRQAGIQHHIPLGLLARAELYRVQGAFEKAQSDLDEAMTIAERGEMGLHQADCHLEYARLYLAMGEKEKAREHMATAKEMIGRMEYHRRDREVEELECMLG
jgi:tetratricopeptide (TPR) repeat protein